MNNDSLKNRLQLADETIAILRSSNSQLDRNLSVLQSDFSVLESLLIESGQTLQRLQEMVGLTPFFSLLHGSHFRTKQIHQSTRVRVLPDISYLP